MAGKMRPAFVALHAATLDPATTADVLEARLRAADAVQARHRLSEGAVYMSAQRRYTMLTGTDWRATQQPDDATTWGGSDHRVRLGPQDHVGLGTVHWRCSCGATGTATGHNLDAGRRAHQAHVDQAQVPAC